MAAYTPYPPKGYRARMPAGWWLGRRQLVMFMLREVSSVFAAWFVIETLMQLHALNQGPAAYAEFQDFFRNPVVIIVNVISLLFVIYHAVTWFQAGPKAMAVRMGGKRVPDALVIAPQYVAWAIISAIVAWLLLRG